MRPRFRIKPFPHILQYKFLERWRAGKAKGIYITLDSRHVHNKRLYIHELVHVGQFYALGIPLTLLLWLFGSIFPLYLFGLFAYGLGYTFIPYFKFIAECMAYGIAAHYSDEGDSHDDYMGHGARSLSRNYDLDDEKYNQGKCLKYIYKFYNLWKKVK